MPDSATKDDSETSGIERRRFQRVFVDLEVDYSHEDTYLFAYIRDISATGLFVRTHTPETPGTRLNVRFTPTGDESALELEGIVIWVNPLRPGEPNNLHPGMGIRFENLDGDSRARLVDFVKRFAYLDGPEPDAKTSTSHKHQDLENENAEPDKSAQDELAETAAQDSAIN